MRIAIVGGGQIGGLVAAAAIENGHEVHLVDTNHALVATIVSEGLTIEDSDGMMRYRVGATTDPDTVPRPVDIVLVQVKGFATGAAALGARVMAGPTTVIATLQNGFGNEEVLQGIFPANDLVIGSTTHTVVARSPAHYIHTGRRETFVGPARPTAGGAAETFASAVRRTSFPVHVLSEQDMRTQLWTKFVTTCATLPVSALTRLSIDDLASHGPSGELMDALVRETCAIARAEGFPLDPEERVAFTRDLLARAGGRASMLGDVLAGRRTEIDTINGAAVRMAESRGVDAPLNRAVLALVAGLERSFELSGT